MRKRRNRRKKMKEEEEEDKSKRDKNKNSKKDERYDEEVINFYILIRNTCTSLTSIHKHMQTHL